MSGTNSLGTIYPAQSPGLYILEQDASLQTRGASTTVCQIVAASRRGPEGNTLFTSSDQFLAQCGPSDLSWSFGHVSALAALKQTNQLYFKRVCNTDRLLSYLTVENDFGPPFQGQTRLYGSQVGVLTGVDAGGSPPNTFHLIFSAPLQAGLTHILGVTDNVVGVQFPQVAYANNSDTTLANLVSSLNGVLQNTLNVGATTKAYAEVVPDPTTTGQNNRVIRVVNANINSLSINYTVTGGSTTTTMQVQNTKLFDIVAQNPGSWANSLAVSISNVNVGTPQILQMSFSGALSAGNIFTAQIIANGVTYIIPPISYATSNDATLNAIAAQIQTVLGGNSATNVVHVNSTTTDDRVINIFSPVTGPNTISVSYAVITGGSPVVTSTITYSNGIAAPNTFNINVFTSTNFNNSIESFTVSLFQQVDGFGNQQYITDVINTGPKKSNFIRIAMSNEDPAGSIQLVNLPTVPTYLKGGYDGSLPTNSQIITAWEALADPEDSVGIDLLINAGYTNTAVQQEIVSVASRRKDCFAILDMPSNMQATTDALNYRNNVLNINSSYGSIFTPDVQITDLSTDRVVYVPPSGFIAAQFVRIDKTQGVSTSAAGTQKGVLDGVLGLRVIYKKGDRDTLDPAQINCLRTMRNGAGNVIYGVNTLQVAPSLLSYISIRRTFIYVEKVETISLQDVVFDNITKQTEFLLTQRLNSFLQPLKNAGSIKDFYVLCTTDNNPGYVTDAGQLNCTVYIVPVVPAKVLVIKNIVTPNSLSFSELITNGII